MRTYWDTSAVMNAAVSAEVARLLDSGEHVTRTHTFSEFFNRMTGRGIRWVDASGQAHALVMDPGDAAAWLAEFARRVGEADLGRDETLAALTEAKARGVTGRMVHDWLHACAAQKAGCERLLTRNTDDFRLLGAPAAWPD